MDYGSNYGSRLSKFFKGFNTKNFQFDEIDLRFSGSLYGVLYREECIKQKGSLAQADCRYWNWSDVEISDLQFRWALDLERYFYKSDYLFTNGS